MCYTNGDADIKTTDGTSRVLGGDIWSDEPDRDEVHVTTSIFVRSTEQQVKTHIVLETMDVNYGDTTLHLPKDVYLAIAAQVEETERRMFEAKECAEAGCNGDHTTPNDNIILSDN